MRTKTIDPGTRQGPPTPRHDRRRRGFRPQSSGPARARMGKLIPHPLAWVDPVTNQPPPRRVSHTNFIRRAAKKNAPHRVTRAEMLRSVRELDDPTATRSVVSEVKRWAWAWRDRGLLDEPE